MAINTPQKATHLLTKPEKYLTRYGTFFRKTSLDELYVVNNTYGKKYKLVIGEEVTE